MSHRLLAVRADAGGRILSVGNSGDFGVEHLYATGVVEHGCDSAKVKRIIPMPPIHCIMARGGVRRGSWCVTSVMTEAPVV